MTSNGTNTAHTRADARGVEKADRALQGARVGRHRARGRHVHQAKLRKAAGGLRQTRRQAGRLARRALRHALARAVEKGAGDARRARERVRANVTVGDAR